MQRQQNLNIVNRLCLTLVFLWLSTFPGHAANLTQRDWMVTLVDTIDWSYDLPDEPQVLDTLTSLLAAFSVKR